MKTHIKFTLVELLMVSAILGILIGLMMPVLGNVRKRAKSSYCSNNLKQISITMMSYLNDNASTFPIAAQKPTVNTGEKPIVEILDNYIKTRKMFQCPEDTKTENSWSGNSIMKTFYEAELSSYEYQSMLAGCRTLASPT